MSPYHAVASLAFLYSLASALTEGKLHVVAHEPLSALLGGGASGGEWGNEGSGSAGGVVVRVGWVGASGLEGGLAAAGIGTTGEEGALSLEQEAALSEAARVGDVSAFCDALKREL